MWKGDDKLRKLKNYKPTKFMAKTSYYDADAADFAVAFIESLCHTKGTWAGKHFELIDWQEQIIRDIFGVLKPNGYRQFNTAYIEIPKKQGKSELAAAVALLLTCGDGEERAEVYGCAADRNQAKIVFDVAVEMVFLQQLGTRSGVETVSERYLQTKSTWVMPFCRRPTRLMFLPRNEYPTTGSFLSTMLRITTKQSFQDSCSCRCRKNFFAGHI